MTENDRLESLVRADRGRLEAAAPAPNFAAFEHAVADMRRARLQTTTALVLGTAITALFIGIAVSLALGEGSRAAWVLAAVMLWVVTDGSLFSRRDGLGPLVMRLGEADPAAARKRNRR